MKNSLIASVILFSFLSCNYQDISMDEKSIETESLSEKKQERSSNKSSTTNSLFGDCQFKEEVGDADDLYNCHGLAFLISEGKPKDWLENDNAYITYVESGLFKEDNSSKATKVFYWNDSVDFANNDFRGITHSAFIAYRNSNGTIVRSKEGAYEMYENNIECYYLSEPFHEYKTYALDLSLEVSSPSTEFMIGDTFEVSTPADGRELGVSYFPWEFDNSTLDLISSSGYKAVFRVIACGSTRIELEARHQTGVTGNDNRSFPVNVSSFININIEDCPTEPDPVDLNQTVHISGPNYMGSGVNWMVWNYNGEINNAQSFKWFYKKTGTNGLPYVIAQSANLLFFVGPDTIYSSGRNSYFELYLEVTDTGGNIFRSNTYSILKKGKYKHIDN